MKPATNTLTEIFNADVRYVVPLYQRPYVWNREFHWEPLWEDVEVVLDHYLEGAAEPMRHFLGAIVLDQQDTPPGEPVRRLVIDGQQRLTTLQLFMAAASRAASADGCERQARLLAKLTQNDPDLASGDERFKVWPTNANQAAFREVMLSNGARPPSQTILATQSGRHTRTSARQSAAGSTQSIRTPSGCPSDTRLFASC